MHRQSLNALNVARRGLLGRGLPTSRSVRTLDCTLATKGERSTTVYCFCPESLTDEHAGVAFQNQVYNRGSA
jgi:hypothetical protein